MIIELDLERNASISLNRSHLNVIDGKLIDSFISNEHRTALARLYTQLGTSRFIDFDSAWSKSSRSKTERVEAYWAFCEPLAADQEAPNKWMWRGIRFPAILVPSSVTKYEKLLGGAQIRAMGFQDELRPIRNNYDDLKYPLVGVNPTRISLYKSDYRTELTFVYNDDSDVDTERPSSVPFPEEWSDVIAIELEEFMIYNRNHSIFSMITIDSWSRYYQEINKDDVKDSIANAIRLGSEAAAVFIVYNCDESSEFWDALRDNFRDEFERIFELVGIRDSNEVFRVWKTTYRQGLRTISKNGATFREGNPIADLGPLRLTRPRSDDDLI
jgi:hypothetical protein